MPKQKIIRGILDKNLDTIGGLSDFLGLLIYSDNALYLRSQIRRTYPSPAWARWWYCLTAAVRPPGTAPAGRSFPAQYGHRPADATGGLCIGRSFTDALGAWGPSATNKLHRVYTGALLATTISVQNKD